MKEQEENFTCKTNSLGHLEWYDEPGILRKRTKVKEDRSTGIATCTDEFFDETGKLINTNIRTYNWKAIQNGPSPWPLGYGQPC